MRQWSLGDEAREGPQHYRSRTGYDPRSASSRSRRTMYRVEIKPSARRNNGAVGEAVNGDGRIRVHEDRQAADEWAAELAERGERPVWIQDAPPHDRTPNDGYLVARGRVRTAAAPFESEQRALRGAEESDGRDHAAAGHDGAGHCGGSRTTGRRIDAARIGAARATDAPAGPRGGGVTRERRATPPRAHAARPLARGTGSIRRG